ncbi:MAG TPA: hypothetical protein GX530_07585, partial [Corynebacteriales bacterium]|nr:hypothetical protein [Mycobacteriales bacterium]
MKKNTGAVKTAQNEGISTEIQYNQEKDFYKGIGGELRMKAEGLFKKAKEKGISIEDLSINVLKEKKVEFPGVGNVELPLYLVKIRGKDISSGQVIVDGKQIDYYNRYQKYIAQKIENKNAIKDERGRTVLESRRPLIKQNPEFALTEWEMFEIAKELIDDKEFGLEKTITGACDRIIRKLMGENDWLYPEEARLLDEEFSSVQSRVISEQEKKRANPNKTLVKKATQRQINYFKQRLKSMDMDPDDPVVLSNIFVEMGIEQKDID